MRLCRKNEKNFSKFDIRIALYIIVFQKQEAPDAFVHRHSTLSYYTATVYPPKRQFFYAKLLLSEKKKMGGCSDCTWTCNEKSKFGNKSVVLEPDLGKDEKLCEEKQ